MKHCPRCSRPFADTVERCIPDGTTLLDGPPPSAAVEPPEPAPTDFAPIATYAPEPTLPLVGPRPARADESVGHDRVRGRDDGRDGGRDGTRRFLAQWGLPIGGGIFALAAIVAAALVMSSVADDPAPRAPRRDALAGDVTPAGSRTTHATSATSPATRGGPATPVGHVNAWLDFSGPTWVEIHRGTKLLFAGNRQDGDRLPLELGGTLTVRVANAGHAALTNATRTAHRLGNAGTEVVLSLDDSGESPQLRHAPPPPAGRRAHARLEAVDGGGSGGEVALREVDGGVHVRIHAVGLPGSKHGVSIGTAKDCADGRRPSRHLDPHGRDHGGSDGYGGHLGDLGNLESAVDGSADLAVVAVESTLGSDPTSLVGRVVQIHEHPDDFVTDPDGGAGARIACGVIEIEGT